MNCQSHQSYCFRRRMIRCYFLFGLFLLTALILSLVYATILRVNLNLIANWILNCSNVYDLWLVHHLGCIWP
uniref:Uncharacterized protein n=1 Tax=Panstrongylus lignarius TaxID=156445 RepID=A0A224XU39_9HEMI